MFRVLDKQNRLVPGITKDEIRIEDEGEQRKITSFSGDVSYSQIVVAADVSGSMLEVLEPLRSALDNFADLVGGESNQDRGDALLTLLPFSESARVLVDRTPDPAEFKSAVERLRPSGSTALIDAILSTLLKAFGDVPAERAAAPSAARNSGDRSTPIASEFRRKPLAPETATNKRSKFLVVFTDAGENSSAHQWPELASAVLGKEVVIYTVVFDSGTPDANVPKLAAITRDSGGEVYRARANDLSRVYGQIAKNIRGHYALTFGAGDVVNTRQWHHIHVSTTRPGVSVLANAGYCPETPCQKPDGAFVGESPKNWNEVLSLNRDPALIASLKQQLTSLSFAYGPETSRIVSELAQRALLIEKRWDTHDRDAVPHYSSRFVSGASESVSVDTEACGITLAPEHSPIVRQAVNAPGPHVLQVGEPEIRLSRRPTSTPAAGRGEATGDEPYFQSQVVFYLIDNSGGIRSPLKVRCNRPHFLVGNGLVEFAADAISQGLKLSAPNAHP